VVSVKVVDVPPLAGIVRELGRFTVTPSGAAPLQTTSTLTEEVNPLTEETSIVDDSDMSGDKLISVSGNGWAIELIEKSGTVTGARTGRVPAMVTEISIA